MVHIGSAAGASDPASGAPPWLVALILVALAVATILGYNRLNRPDPFGEPVQVRRSRRYRRFLAAEAAAQAASEGDPVDPLGATAPPPAHPATSVVDSPPSIPRADEPTSPPPSGPAPDTLDLQSRLALLDEALAAGSLGADEHRVLRTALLEDDPDAG